MTAFLLDTNHLSAALAPVSRVRERILQARLAGDRLGTTVPVLCELEVGIQQTGHEEDCRRELARLLKQVRVWPLGMETARMYGEIYLDLRRRGHVLSQVDILTAVVAKLMRLTVLTTDRDFEALPHIRTENWTV